MYAARYTYIMYVHVCVCLLCLHVYCVPVQCTVHDGECFPWEPAVDVFLFIVPHSSLGPVKCGQMCGGL